MTLLVKYVYLLVYISTSVLYILQKKKRDSISNAKASDIFSAKKGVFVYHMFIIKFNISLSNNVDRFEQLSPIFIFILFFLYFDLT